MIRTRLIAAALFLVTGFAAPAVCQVTEPERPPEPPVWKFEAVNVPVLRHSPNTNPTNPRWLTGWNIGSPGYTQVNEQVARIILGYHAPNGYRCSPSSWTPILDYHEFGGMAKKFGQSGPWTPTNGGQGWYRNGYLYHCHKPMVEPYGSNSPTYQTMWEQWPGETSMTMVTFPCIARELRIRFSNNVAVGARFDEDGGTPCLTGHLGMICRNPQCPQFNECRLPWAYPNLPHALCGQDGPDPSLKRLAFSQFTTPNMISVGSQPSKWEAATVANTGNIRNAGTIQQSFTSTGTPRMWFWLVQTDARSDLTYNAPARNGNSGGPHETYPTWTDGIYATLVYDLIMHRSGSYAGGSPKYVAHFKAEKYALWSFTVPGLFKFIGDWFACDRFADFNSDGCHDAADVFAFLTAWFEGS